MTAGGLMHRDKGPEGLGYTLDTLSMRKNCRHACRIPNPAYWYQ